MAADIGGVQRCTRFRQVEGRSFQASTVRRWGCRTTLLRAARAGARHFFRERALRRTSCSGHAQPRLSSEAGHQPECIMYAKVGPKSYSTETQAAAGDCCRTGESSGDLPRRRRGCRGGRTQPKARRTQRADEEMLGEKRGALSAESPDVLLSSAADSAGFGPASREAFAGSPSRRSREFEAVPRCLQE